MAIIEDSPHDTVPLEAARDAEPAAPLSRRRLLGWGAALVASAALGAADRREIDTHWATDESALHILPGSAPTADEGWLVVPGFGSEHGKSMALDLRRTWQNTERVAYLNYSNRGIELEDIVDLTERYSKTLGSLSLYGHSMGGPTGLLAARDLRIPLKRVVFNCSPFSIDDSYAGATGKIVAKAAEYLHYKGDLIGTYIGTVAADTQRHGVHTLLDNIRHGMTHTLDGASPDMLVSQIKLLDRSDLNAVRKDFDGIIIPGFTEVLYCAPADVYRDRTVNNRTAYPKWQDFFGYFGIDVTYLGVPDAGHADTYRASIAAESWISKTSISDHGRQA